MNRAALLDALIEMASSLESVDEVIAPFGFEADSTFPIERVAPKRVYLYVRVRHGWDIDDANEQIAGWWTAAATGLSEALGSATAHLSLGGRRLPLTLSPGPGNSTFVYYVPPSAESLLEQYARYLVLVPVAIANGTLNELTYFESRPSCRRFVYQSIRMVPALHGLALPVGADVMLDELSRLNGLHDYATVRAERAMTPEDRHALESIVLPVCDELRLQLIDDTGAECVWHDFHTGSSETMAVRAGVVERSIRRAVNGYQELGVGRRRRVG